MFSLSLTFSLHAADQTISMFLKEEIDSSQQTLLFRFVGGSANAIAQVRIHYLSSPDCQSGYIGFINSSPQSSIFLLKPNQLFGLSANAVYTAGMTASSIQSIQSIHSLLIRFISPSGQFARFTSSCNDENINCCVAVNCSNATGACLSQQLMPDQDFILNM